MFHTFVDSNIAFSKGFPQELPILGNHLTNYISLRIQ